jgi:hypothetical protein
MLTEIILFFYFNKNTTIINFVLYEIKIYDISIKLAVIFIDIFINRF